METGHERVPEGDALRFCWQDLCMGSILVVEDDKDIRDVLRRYLERAGHLVVSTGSGAEALRLLREAAVDIVLLDLGLPDIDGTEILASIGDDNQTRVIVLTARGTVDERIRGLQLGADDYVVKPFSPTEVVLRVNAVLSRTVAGGAETSALSFGGGRLVIDTELRTVTCDGTRLELTPTEWATLETLTSVPGRPFTRFELINKVRGYEFVGYERVIDSHIKNLRQKLGSMGHEIVVTVQGVGYRLGWKRDE